MKITAIKQQVKRVGRYSIFVDGKYSFSLSESELLNTKLVPNQEITAGQLEQLKGTAVIDKAFGRALNLVAHRPRSEWELRDYLRRKDHEPETIEAVIAKLDKYGYVNDAAFAKQWVQSRRLLKATSKRRLQQELRQKHIENDIIDATLAEDETDERQVLRELVEKKRSHYPDDLKLMQYLARQGYGYDDIKTVLHGDPDED